MPLNSASWTRHCISLLCDLSLPFAAVAINRGGGVHTCLVLALAKLAHFSGCEYLCSKDMALLGILLTCFSIMLFVRVHTR